MTSGRPRPPAAMVAVGQESRALSSAEALLGQIEGEHRPDAERCELELQGNSATVEACAIRIA